jgi:hypothetical protein
MAMTNDRGGYHVVVRHGATLHDAFLPSTFGPPWDKSRILAPGESSVVASDRHLSAARERGG